MHTDKDTFRPMLAFFLAAGIYFCHAVIYLPLMLDDPFITYRYAKNLSIGNGLVWNASEAPVEGFTTPLGVLLALFSEKIGLFPLLFFKIVGVVSVLATLAIILFGAKQLLPSLWQRCLAAVLLVLCADVVYYSVSGMENSIFMALATLIFINVLSEKTEGHAVQNGLIAALLCWCRPEGNFLALGLGCVYAFSAFKNKNKRDFLIYSTIVAAIVLPLHIGRLLIFGDFVPNTYYAKHTGQHLIWALFDGARYLGNQCLSYYPFIVLATMACFSLDKRSRIFLLTSLLIFILYPVKVGGDDIAAFSGARLILPIIPLVFILAIHFISKFEGGPAARFLIYAVLIAVFACSQVNLDLYNYKKISNANGLSDLSLTTIKDDAVQHSLYLIHPEKSVLSRYLLRNTPPHQYIAIPWAGRVAYETMLPTIDLLGLNDRHIARLPKKQRGIDVKYDADYVLSRRPFFICENFEFGKSDMSTIEKMTDSELYGIGAWKVGQRNLLRSPILHKDYKLVDDLKGQPYACFERNDAHVDGGESQLPIVPKLSQSPGEPSATHTHPTGEPRCGAVLKTMAPRGQLPELGGVAPCATEFFKGSAAAGVTVSARLPEFSKKRTLPAGLASVVPIQ